MKARIKEVRKEADLTQAAFGKRIGLTQNYVAMIESGQREPGPRTIRDICREFNISEPWLRKGLGTMHGNNEREIDLTREIGRMFSTRPDSFKTAAITCLMRFEPDGEEWEILERIYHGIEAELKKEE